MEETGKSVSAAVVMAVVVLTAFFITLVGCQPQEGPAEKAGKQVDRAAEKIGQEVEKAGNSIQEAAKESRK